MDTSNGKWRLSIKIISSTGMSGKPKFYEKSMFSQMFSKVYNVRVVVNVISSQFMGLFEVKMHASSWTKL